MSNRLPQTVTLLYLILGITLVLGIAEAVPMAADGGKLVLDALWLGLLVYLIKFAADAFDGILWCFAGWALAFLLIMVLTAVVQGQKPWLSFWALRNNFRFYCVFLGAGAFLRRQDREDIHRLLEGLFWGNVPVTLVQFFLLDIRGDNLGGILGTYSGVNGSTSLFFSVVLTHSLLQYLQGEEGLPRCFGKCLAALILAAMAELKFAVSQDTLSTLQKHVDLYNYGWELISSCNAMMTPYGLAGRSDGEMIFAPEPPSHWETMKME